MQTGGYSRSLTAPPEGRVPVRSVRSKKRQESQKRWVERQKASPPGSHGCQHTTSRWRLSEHSFGERDSNIFVAGTQLVQLRSDLVGSEGEDRNHQHALQVRVRDTQETLAQLEAEMQRMRLARVRRLAACW